MSESTVLILTTAGCSYCAKAKTLLKTFNQELMSQQRSKTSHPVHDLLLDVVSVNIPAEEDGKSTTIMPTAREAHTALSTKFEHSTFPLVLVLHSVDPSTLQQQQEAGGIVMEYIGGFTELKERVDKVREKKSSGGDGSELLLFPFPSLGGTIVKIATDGGGGDQQDVANWTSTGVNKLLSANGVTITSAAIASAATSSSEPAATHSQLLNETYGLVVAGGVNLLQEALSGQQTPTTQTPPYPRQTGAIHPEIYVSTFMGWHADAGAIMQGEAKATTTTPLRSKQWFTLLLDEARDRAALRRVAAVYAETTAAAAARGAEGSVPFADTILSVAASSEGQHRLPISLSDLSRFVLYSFPVSACVNKKETGEGEIVTPVYYSNGARPYAELPNKAAIESAVGDEVLRSLSPSSGSEGITTAISADTEKAVKEFLTPQQHGLLKRMCGGYLQTETERLLFGWVQPTTTTTTSSTRLPASCWDEELVGAHSVQRQPRLFWTHESLLKSVLEPYSTLYSSHVNAIISSAAANDADDKKKQQKAITVTADALLSTLLRDGVVQLIKGENNNDNIYRWTGRVAVSSNGSSGGGSTSTTLAPSRWYASGTRDTTTQRMSVPFPPPDLHSNTIINAEIRTLGSQHRGSVGDDFATTTTPQQYDAIVNASAVLRSTMDALRDSFVEGPLPASSPLISPVPLSKTEEALKDEVASAGGISGVRYDALGHSSTFAWAASSLLASHLGTYNPRINWNHFFTAAPRAIVTATLINLYNCLVTIRMAIVLGQKETHSSLPSSMITQYKFFYTKMVAFSSSPQKNNSSNNTFSFSLDEIENGLLRGNRVGVSSMISKKGPFGAATEGGSDPRLGWAMNANDTDYRIHAALNCGASSCPPVRVFHSSNLNAQLHTAFTAFVQSTTKIQWKSPWTDAAVVTLLQKHNQTKGNVVSVSSLPPPPEITLSMIFKWYREDFAHPIPTHNYTNETTTTTTKSSIDDVAIIAAADNISAFCTDVSEQSVLGVIVKYLQPSKRESLLAWATLSRLAASTPGQKSSNLSLSYSHYDWGNDAAAPNTAAK